MTEETFADSHTNPSTRHIDLYRPNPCNFSFVKVLQVYHFDKMDSKYLLNIIEAVLTAFCSTSCISHCSHTTLPSVSYSIATLFSALQLVASFVSSVFPPSVADCSPCLWTTASLELDYFHGQFSLR